MARPNPRPDDTDAAADHGALEPNPSQADRLRIEVLLTGDTAGRAMLQLRDGLLQTPRTTSPHFFYDDSGSRLFERITQLAAYYQTRTEAGILEQIGPEVVARTGVQCLVELGSGASAKTRLLLDAMARAGRLHYYVPFDVSEGIVRREGMALLAEYAGLRVNGIVGEFAEHLDALPPLPHRLVIFLGSTIGNFTPLQAATFLRRLRAVMQDGEHLLLGFDLIKDSEQLQRAYDDPEGVTAAFNRNALRVINRFAHANFDPEAFAHRALYNANRHRIEMWLDATRAQRVVLQAMGLTLLFERGDSIRTEISVKYDRPRAEALLSQGGFAALEWYTDPDANFALSLSRCDRVAR